MTKREPYRRNTGNKCTIKFHNHAPHECPGRARLKCKVCGKALIKHKGFDYCDQGLEEPTFVVDELGKRRKARG